MGQSPHKRKSLWKAAAALLLITPIVDGGAASAQTNGLKAEVALDFDWTLTGKGIGGYLQLHFKARYAARREMDLKACDSFWPWPQPIRECYAVAPVSGAFVGGNGYMAKEAAELTDSGCFGSMQMTNLLPGFGKCPPNQIKPASPWFDSVNAGHIIVGKDGYAEILLTKGPVFDTNGPGQDATSCFYLDKENSVAFKGLAPGDLYSTHKHWNFTVSNPEYMDCQYNVDLQIDASCIGSNSLDLFQTMMPAFSHPRCMNCHGLTNPITGANHGGGKIDVGPQKPGSDITTPAGNGVCLDCHTALVRKDSSGVERGPWRMAPAQVSFVGKDTKAICQQVAEFGFPDPALGTQFFETHVAGDDLIGLAFVGRSGDAAKTSSPPPMGRPQFVQLAMKWATDGRHGCGCTGPTTSDP